MTDQPIGRLEAIVIDVSNLDRAASFWSGVLGVPFGPSVMPQFRRANLVSGLHVVLQLVPERKADKNRVHVDIEVADLGEALRRVEALGGSKVRLVEDEGFDPLYICADPDGNEFCVTLPS
jgi:predicted enzyme related to lactoylglutathione lyase